MILMDIGNRNAHIYHNDVVEHLLVEDAISRYDSEQIFYITVNHKLEDTLSSVHTWTNISKDIYISGEYDGMGVDRKALCLSRGDGVYVDAGSAITVDKVLHDRYEGGFILPGVYAYKKSFASISKVLDVELDKNISLKKLPKETSDSINYGMTCSIVESINSILGDLPIYFTGGDGEWLSKYFDGSIYSEQLLFEGMIKTIKGMKC